MLVLAIILTLTVMDQAVKCLVERHFMLGDGITVIPGLFDLRYVRNTGAAFGMLDSMGAILIVFSIVVLVVLILLRRRFLNCGVLSELAFALMLAGIVGNLLDRLRAGFVVDFLDFYWGSKHFPAFNIADACICTGVALYVLASFLVPHARHTQPPQAQQQSDSRPQKGGVAL